MATIFTRIVKGEIPCYKIAEDEHYFAFLDINPNAEGHTIVIPKIEDDYIFHLEEDTYIGLQLFARKVAKALEATISCKRIGVVVIGLEVPHTHIHLIPMNSEKDINMSHKTKVSPERMAEIASQVAEKLR